MGSHDALELLVDTHGEWQGSIRADSVKHIVVVSDDESDLEAAEFDTQFGELAPDYESYVMHAIVCPWDCPEAADIGQTYLDLVGLSGGVLGDLCEQDFQPVFDELADAVIQGVPLSCQFEVPEPPMNMELDPDLVNVELDDGNGNVEVIPAVPDLAACMNAAEGWYYDDPLNPQQIILCPQTCQKAQSYMQGEVNVTFGCETVMVE